MVRSSTELVSQCSQNPLDTVRDCADLAGSFRHEVTYDSVLFVHGDMNTMSPEEIEANTYRVAGACLLATHIGIEVASARNAAIMRRDFELINEALQQGRPMPEAVVNKWVADGIYGIARGLKEGGRDDVPGFFPIDKWEDPEFGVRLLAENDTAAKGRDGFILKLADTMRQREAITIRQLEAKGREIDNGTERHIAYVQGLYHGNTHVAMKALGARTTRTYVDAPGHSLVMTAVDQLRTSGNDTHDPTEFSTLESAVRLYDYLRTASGGLLEAIAGEHAKADIYARLGHACIRGYRRLLDGETQHLFRRLDEALREGERPFIIRLLADAFAEAAATLAP